MLRACNLCYIAKWQPVTAGLWRAVPGLKCQCHEAKWPGYRLVFMVEFTYEKVGNPGRISCEPGDKKADIQWLRRAGEILCR